MPFSAPTEGAPRAMECYTQIRRRKERIKLSLREVRMTRRQLLTWVLVLCASSVAPAKKNLGWVPLFNGKNLSGWKHIGPGSFVVEHGLLKSQGGMGLLYATMGPVADCEIRVVYRMEHQNDNS